MRGNGNANSAQTNTVFNICVPNVDVMVHPSSILAFINPENMRHAIHRKHNAMLIGITTSPIAEYARGISVDIDDMTSENIWHVQQLEKNLYALAKSTGAVERNIEKPTIPPIPANVPNNTGAIAPADSGRKEKNTIENFFNQFIVLSISHIVTNMI